MLSCILFYNKNKKETKTYPIMMYTQVATCKYVTLVTQEIKVVERQSIILNLEEMRLRNNNLSTTAGDKMLKLFPQKFCCGASNEHLDNIESDLKLSPESILAEINCNNKR